MRSRVVHDELGVDHDPVLLHVASIAKILHVPIHYLDDLGCSLSSNRAVTVSQACGSGGAGVRPLTRADWRGPGAGGARSERPLGFVMV
jgi:hypothetical protein